MITVVVVMHKKVLLKNSMHAKIFGAQCAYGIRKKYGKMVTVNARDEKRVLIVLSFPWSSFGNFHNTKEKNKQVNIMFTG